MAIELATQYLPFVDEIFTTESKRDLLSGQNFDWSGAHSIRIWRVDSSDMNDYGRTGPDSGNWSRYGPVSALDADTQEMTLRKDRSFTFAIDRLDSDETKQQVSAASALARQLREKVIPEVDSWAYLQMCENAGLVPTPLALTKANIYEQIVEANNALDNAEVPETNRSLVVSPDIYLLLKLNRDIILETDIGNDLRLRGVIAILDGLKIIKVPANRLPDDFGFMIAHPIATTMPVKLESYKIHEDPPGINGSLVEGRVAYDTFVLERKAKAILYQAQA